MEFLFPLLLSIHILVGLGVIGLVLLQHGKGADMGAAFGSGASGSLFGASGSANFLSRTTAILAGVFFVTSLGLSYLSGNRPKAAGSVMEAPLAPPPAAGAVTVPLPGSEKAADVPVPSEKPAPGAEQKPADGGAEQPAAAQQPAASTGGKDGPASGAKAGAPAAENKAPAAADAKADQKAEAKPDKAAAGKTVEKPASIPAKGEKDAAGRGASEAPVTDSKAKDIPK